MNRKHHYAEPLEARIAPASVIHFTDVDGDKVTITASKGDVTNKALFLNYGTLYGPREELTVLDLSSKAFNGANITISVLKNPAGGDGSVKVDHIEGGTNNFGTISIQGNLGDIDCGSGKGATAIGTLHVQGLGPYETVPLGGTGDLISTINGSLGRLFVKGNVENAALKVTHDIESISIGGSLIGGTTDYSGYIGSHGNIGSVKIGGDLKGGDGVYSGTIKALDGKLGSCTISGSVLGGAGKHSGTIYGENIGAIKIGHDLQGGSYYYSGGIHSGSFIGYSSSQGGKIQSCTIGGSVIGGANRGTAQITALGNIGIIKIGGDVQGGDGDSSAIILGYSNVKTCTIGGSLIGGLGGGSGLVQANDKLSNLTLGADLVGGEGLGAGCIEGGTLVKSTISGYVRGGSGDYTGNIAFYSGIGSVKIGKDLVGGSISGTTENLKFSGSITTKGSIKTVNIGGSIVAGTDDSSDGGIASSAAIQAGVTIGAIEITGEVTGSVGDNGDITQVIISAKGQAKSTATKDIAISKVTIGGNATGMSILAGFSIGYLGGVEAANGNAQIGKVTISGNLVASNIVAGVQDGGNAGFGDYYDTIIGGGTTISKIGSIVIGGMVDGTAGSGDQFGIESHAIGSLSINGSAVAINSPLDIADTTGDVTLRLV
jgi:hypothetical protein